jgi:hypothetical protein
MDFCQSSYYLLVVNPTWCREILNYFFIFIITEMCIMESDFYVGLLWIVRRVTTIISRMKENQRCRQCFFRKLLYIFLYQETLLTITCCRFAIWTIGADKYIFILYDRNMLELYLSKLLKGNSNKVCMWRNLCSFFCYVLML